MAEGGETDDLSSETSLRDNEPVYDFYCIMCKEDGNHVEAKGYCVNCEDYMCSACTNYHRKSRLSRHHEILDSESMPRDTPISERVNRTATTKCPKHPKSTVEYYCKSHGYFGCSTCFALGHRSCSDVENIADESLNVMKRQDFQDFVTTLDSLSLRSRNIMTKCKDNRSKLDTSCSKTVASVNNFRKDLNSKLDEHERDIATAVETFKAETSQEIQQVSGNCESIFESLTLMSFSLKQLLENKKLCDMFIFMKRNGRQIRNFSLALGGIEKQTDLNVFSFHKNVDLLCYLARSNALGSLTLHPFPSEEFCVTKEETSTLKAEYSYDANVKLHKDESVCHITGSVTLDEEKLVVVDSINKKVKLLSIPSKMMVFALDVTSEPRAIAAISHDQVAVTIQSVKKILILKVTDTISLNTEIVTKWDCSGIAHTGGKLIVTYTKPPYVEIMDLKGHGRVLVDSGIFLCPKYVCASNDGNEFYVSDCRKRELMGFKIDGSKTFTVSQISEPQNLSTDLDGNIYVCDSKAITVLMIADKSRRKVVLLSEEDGLIGTPNSVSYCCKTNRLFVGMDANIVRVFKLKNV